MSAIRMLRSVATSAVLLGASARANVWTVDDNGAADFATIQAAINASSDGDTILVQPGGYAAFVLTDKDLRILSAGTPKPQILGSTLIESLASQRSVVLAELHFSGTTATGPALRLNACAGAVRLQRCVLNGVNGVPGGNCAGSCTSGGAGLVANACTNVALVGCSAKGGSAMLCSNNSPCAGYGNTGASMTASAVASYDCSFTGGNSGTATWYSGYTPYGGDGFHAPGSFVFANTSPMIGGLGGGFAPPTFHCNNSSWFQYLGRGGHGCTVEGALPSTVWFVQPDLIGGDYGSSTCFFAFDELPRSRQFARGPQGSTAARVPGQSRRSLLPSVLAGTNFASATFNGAPGDVVEVFVSPNPDFVWSLPQRGVWAISLATALAPVTAGTIDASGQLTTLLALPTLQAGQASQTWHLQPLFHAATSFIGSPSIVTLVP